ncbi:hypothetical protein GCM10010254_47040 [Streptomyces chromofuscus]|nr:hypothetical protein GCM10010254_47040 [Streptomyces chromofuscus]
MHIPTEKGRQSVECPRCGQALLERVQATRFSIRFAKCPECDAIWPEDGLIDRGNFVQYQLFLDLLGEPEMESPYKVLGLL